MDKREEAQIEENVARIEEEHKTEIKEITEEGPEYSEWTQGPPTGHFPNGGSHNPGAPGAGRGGQ